MEDAGASAVVLHSLFEEQMRHDSHELHYHLDAGHGKFRGVADLFSRTSEVQGSVPEAYLEHIAKAKAAVDIPIIASLNGSTFGGWIEYAQQIEQAGADALELNIYSIPTDPDSAGRGNRKRIPHDSRPR